MGVVRYLLNKSLTPSFLLLGIFLSGCFEDTQIQSSESSVSLALSLSGAPAPNTYSNQSVLNITVSGNFISAYKYALSAADSPLDCSDPNTYTGSIAIPTNNLISNALGADGSYVLCIFGQDAYGVWQTEDQALRLDWVKDTAVPTGAAILIAAGSVYTLDQDPDLNLSASGAVEMYITNTSGCTSDGMWETISAAKSNWTLSSTNSTQIVYVKFRDESLNESTCVSDSIIHDGASPSLLGSANDGTTFNSLNTSPVISWPAASDSGGSGINYYELAIGTFVGATNSLNWTNVGNLTSYQASGLSLADGVTYYASVRAVDGAGNISSEITSDGWLVDVSPPVANSIAINSGASYTNTLLVNLTLSATDATSMYVTNTAGCLTGGTWESYSTSKSSWSLSGSNSSQSVYVMFKDSASNLSACINSAISHDNLAASAPSGLMDGVSSYASVSQTPNITWSIASDNGPSGVAQYELAIGTFAGATNILNWTSIGNMTSYQVSSLSLSEWTTYYVGVRAVDAAGNTGAESWSDGWVADISAPVVYNLFNNSTYTAAKTWNWLCTEACTYRYVIDQNPGTVPTGTFTSGTTATQSTGTGTYYIHVQATDTAGNLSAVVHVSAMIDSSPPIGAPGVPTPSAPFNFLYQTPTLSFTTSAFDPESGIAYYEVQVYRTSDNSIIVPWGKITNSKYMFKNSLVNLVSYYVKVRGVNGAGLPGLESSPSANWTPGCSSTTININATTAYSTGYGNYCLVVPAGVSTMSVKTWGAGGGGSYAGGNSSGGAGGYANGVISVSPGELLLITVGGGGERGQVSSGGAGGFGGGGKGSSKGSTGYYFGAGGGGFTGIFRSNMTPIIIAGAGGGAQGDVGAQGAGAGGGLIGVNSGEIAGGRGGTQIAGGAGGTTCGFVGASLMGGDADVISSYGYGGGGGGGSGYFGGGGGCSGELGYTKSSSGGGGSSYFAAGVAPINTSSGAGIWPSAEFDPDRTSGGSPGNTGFGGLNNTEDGGPGRIFISW